MAAGGGHGQSPRRIVLRPEPRPPRDLHQPAALAADLQAIAPDEAIAKVIRDYLFAYGPATPQKFAQWIGAPPLWAIEQFEQCQRDLTEVTLDGTPAWVVEGDTSMPPAKEAVGSVLLLPYFDAYVVGSHPRDPLFPGQATSRARAPSGQTGNYPVLVVDGVVAGVWHQRRSGKLIDLTVEPLHRLSAPQPRTPSETLST